jgi:hypothetical protein
VAKVGWLPPSPRQVATAQADERRGRRVAVVYCGACAGDRRAVASIHESPAGPLFVADVVNKEATRVARDWSADDLGRIPPGRTLVRVLLDDVGAERLECQCAKHSALEADPDEARRAVIAYRRTGRVAKVRALPTATP